jgi:hypothetical protein
MIVALTQAALAIKLAQAVASTHGLMDTKVYVGALPPGTKAAGPLPKFTLLGTVVQSAAPGTSETTQPLPSATYYYELPPNAQSALDAYKKQLAAAGWKESTVFARFDLEATPRGGFAVTQSRPQFPDLYCNDRGGFLALMRLKTLPQDLAVGFGGGPEVTTLCKIGAVLQAMPTPAPPPQLPTLQAPANVTMEAGTKFGMLFSSPAAQSEASLTSSVPLSTIGSAFAQQLSTAGWAADQAAQSSSAYVQTFRMTNKGRHLYAVLSLLSVGKPQQYDATLKVVDLDARPNAGGGFSFPFFP